MNLNFLPAVALPARLLVGGVLVYAGATKAAGPSEEFAIVIGAYDLLSKDMVITAATFLPWAELLLGWALIFGFKLRVAAAAAGALFAGFLLALANVKAKGIELPNCGCFGDAIHFTPVQAFVFDSLLIALCFAAWKAGPGVWSLDSWAEGGYTGATHGK